MSGGHRIHCCSTGCSRTGLAGEKKPLEGVHIDGLFSFSRNVAECSTRVRNSACVGCGGCSCDVA